MRLFPVAGMQSKGSQWTWWHSHSRNPWIDRTWWMPRAAKNLPKWEVLLSAASSRSMRLVSGTNTVHSRPYQAHPTTVTSLSRCITP